jgi:major membrane immunogen (membrane-anchored lipoprotein)
MITYNQKRNILAASVSIFVDDETTKSTHYYSKDDFCADGDNQINIPDGKVVKVTLEYADRSEI